MDGFDLPVLRLEEAIKYGVLKIILFLVTLNEWLRCSFMYRRSIRENWMARIGLKCLGIGLVALIFLSSLWRTPTLVSASELRGQKFSILEADNEVEPSYFEDLLNFFWQDGRLGYHKVWPKMEFGWRIIVGAAIGFFGAAFGSVGGVGGGGIFVPMLTLIVGFDQKSSTAISKCMITGAAVSTVIYNLRLRNPTLDMPLIDYDLALLFQPMLVLGISIGVAFNVIFADWMITVLLIIIFIITATKAMLKGIETWKKETIIKKEAARGPQEDEVEYKPLAGGPSNGASQPPPNEATTVVVPILSNIRWKELGVLTGVWLAVLALQIIKLYMTTCSVGYWIVNVLQFPATMGVSAYQSFCLYKGRRVIASKGAQANTNWKILHLVFYCFVGMFAGVVGGMLGLGGGFILGPVFLEMGIPPQVSSATATFAMIFSASMSVVEYYLLKRFPVPYALFFVAVATASAVVGQLVVRKLVSILGRASLIIFILAFTIYISAVALGGVGLVRMIRRIERHEYMGFDDLCTAS